MLLPDLEGGVFEAGLGVVRGIEDSTVETEVRLYRL